MNELEELLSNRWIVKAENKEKFYRVKDALGEISKFTSEKMGCSIISNSSIIKLEKIPNKVENYMGIENFTKIIEYVFLCTILMFLEDKDPEEQFILSQLTEYISINVTEEKIDWSLRSNRLSLIKVIRFCQDSHMIKINDGNEDLFTSDYTSEILYENTGASRYFMRNFTKDIMKFEEIKDFEYDEFSEASTDLAIAKRHRIYKKILFSTGIYSEGEFDEDFNYLKRYGDRINEDLIKRFDCKLQIHKTSAYLIKGNDCKIGDSFPENNSLSDIILLCNKLIYEEIKLGKMLLNVKETTQISEHEFKRIILSCKQKYESGFSKTFRNKNDHEFFEIILKRMEDLTFIERDLLNKEIIIKPIVGKIIGEYPKDYKLEEI